MAKEKEGCVVWGGERVECEFICQFCGGGTNKEN